MFLLFSKKKKNGKFILKLPRTLGRGLEGSVATVVWRFTSFDSSNGILMCRASWWIYINFTSGVVVLQWGHSNLAWPPFSTPKPVSQFGLAIALVGCGCVDLSCYLLGRVLLWLGLACHGDLIGFREMGFYWFLIGRKRIIEGRLGTENSSRLGGSWGRWQWQWWMIPDRIVVSNGRLILVKKKKKSELF